MNNSNLNKHLTKNSGKSPNHAVQPNSNMLSKSPVMQTHGLLPQPDNPDQICLILDLDETLVHATITNVGNHHKSPHDFVLILEGQKITVKKRPYLDEFLSKLRPYFEIVLFTASMAEYAEPIIQNLNFKFDYCLYRESCTKIKQNGQDVYVKDLSRLGRDLKKTIIVDNSPTSYLFHPRNGLPCKSWYSSEKDTELLEILHFLRHCVMQKQKEDVRNLLSLHVVYGKLIYMEHKIKFISKNTF